MSPGDLEIAMQFGTALQGAARTGDWTAVYPLLAADVEWVTPRRTLSGIEEREHDQIWGYPPEHLDLEFEVGDWLPTSVAAARPSTSARSTARKGRATSPTTATSTSSS
jgi:hypothetical protein